MKGDISAFDCPNSSLSLLLRWKRGHYRNLKPIRWCVHAITDALRRQHFPLLYLICCLRLSMYSGRMSTALLARETALKLTLQASASLVQTFTAICEEKPSLRSSCFSPLQRDGQEQHLEKSREMICKRGNLSVVGRRGRRGSVVLDPKAPAQSSNRCANPLWKHHTV